MSKTNHDGAPFGKKQEDLAKAAGEWRKAIAAQKPFFLKITPGTDLYRMALAVQQTVPKETRQKCVRLLAIAGYGVFQQSLKADPEEEE